MKRKLYSMNTLALQVLIENMQLVKLIPVLRGKLTLLIIKL